VGRGILFRRFRLFEEFLEHFAFCGHQGFPPDGIAALAHAGDCSRLLGAPGGFVEIELGLADADQLPGGDMTEIRVLQRLQVFRPQFGFIAEGEGSRAGAPADASIPRAIPLSLAIA